MAKGEARLDLWRLRDSNWGENEDWTLTLNPNPNPNTEAVEDFFDISLDLSEVKKKPTPDRQRPITNTGLEGLRVRGVGG